VSVVSSTEFFSRDPIQQPSVVKGGGALDRGGGLVVHAAVDRVGDDAHVSRPSTPTGAE